MCYWQMYEATFPHAHAPLSSVCAGSPEAGSAQLADGLRKFDMEPLAGKWFSEDQSVPYLKAQTKRASEILRLAHHAMVRVF